MIGTRYKQGMFPYRSQIWAAAESRNQENHREMDIRLIDFERLEVYEAEAVLLTCSLPNESEEIRSEVHASLCVHALRVKCAMEPTGL
jgi:hypothetical protein